MTVIECDKCLRELKLIKQEEHKFLSHLFAPCFCVQENIYSPLSPCHVWARKETDLPLFLWKSQPLQRTIYWLISTCSLHRDTAHVDSGVISAQIQPIAYAGRGTVTSTNRFEEVRMAYLHLPLTRIQAKLGQKVFKSTVYSTHQAILFKFSQGISCISNGKVQN